MPAEARVPSRHRARLIARLWRTAARQVSEIEGRLTAAGGDVANLERDAKTLAVLARTGRALVALDAEADPSRTGDRHEQPDPPRDIDAFRRELADKLAELGALERGD